MGLLESLFGKGKRRDPARVGGDIGYHQLGGWWLDDLTAQDREQIRELHRPLGSDHLPDEGEIKHTTQSALAFLKSIAGFIRKENKPLCYKVLSKAEELIDQGKVSYLDAHFFYQEKLGIYYPDRNDPACLDKAIEACKQQIAVAEGAKKEFLTLPVERRSPTGSEDTPLPAHKGYHQLCIIYERQQRFDKVIALCEQAEAQGWPGDWDSRAEKCRKKALKTSKS